jgi:hypothetical protein
MILNAFICYNMLFAALCCAVILHLQFDRLTKTNKTFASYSFLIRIKYPPKQSYSPPPGTCVILGDRNNSGLPFAIKLGDCFRLGSVGLVVSELRTADGEEQRLDSRMLQVIESSLAWEQRCGMGRTKTHQHDYDILLASYTSNTVRHTSYNSSQCITFLASI